MPEQRFVASQRVGGISFAEALATVLGVNQTYTTTVSRALSRRLDVVVDAEEVVGIVLALDRSQLFEIVTVLILSGLSSVSRIGRKVQIGPARPIQSTCRIDRGANPIAHLIELGGVVVSLRRMLSMNGALRSPNAVSAAATAAVAPPMMGTWMRVFGRVESSRVVDER